MELINPFDKEKYPFCHSGHQYALDIISGSIVSNIYIKGACQRYLNDLAENTKFYFDPDKAERFLRLAQRFKHVKGEWKTPTLVFEPWQNFMFMNIHGFISKTTGERRFRTAHIEVARGNGKSAIASVEGLYDLSLDSPKGNEIYSAATGKDQAKIVLDSARAMAKANKSFLQKTGTRVLAHQIIHEKSNSFFKALSSDSNTLDGLQPKTAIIDELHAHRNRHVFDVIDSAMSKRRDSLLFVITTAGFDTSGIGYSQSAYAKKVCIGDVEDDSFFAVVYTLDEKDDPFDSEVWPKSNPNWGVSVDPENFAAKAKKARESSEDLSNFKVKHLNLWINSSSPFFSVEKWKELADPSLKIENFLGQKCWTSVDLASKIDLASKAFIFKITDPKNPSAPCKYAIFTKNYIPEQTLNESSNNAYKRWKEKGFLISTQGEAINYPYLQDEFEKTSKSHKFVGVHYDPWSANEFAQRMAAKRMNMIEFRMTTANLSEPMKTLDALIRQKRIIHDGNELVTWCLGNVVAKRDANENVFPRKENEKLKIDPAVAMIMALAGWIGEEANESVYEKRGIIVL